MARFCPVLFVMAAIASAATSRGVASGLNLAKHLTRSRAWGSRASSAAHHRFRRAASACFVGSDEVTKESRASSAPPSPPPASTEASRIAAAAADADDAGDGDAVERAARDCRSIARSLPNTPRDFGGLRHVDTSSLAARGAHRVVFVLGGPGAGKGTQSARIVAGYECVHLSVGDLLRAGAERPGYEHADLVKECLVKGNIVPVEISLGLLRIAMDERAAEGGGGARIFLVDGFPRNFDNLRGWTEHMSSHTAVLGSLVYNCPIDVLERRILTRAETSGRTDDNLDSARRRFATFREQTEPVVRALERVQQLQAEEGGAGGGSQLKVFNIEAAGTVEEVWEATAAAMGAYVRDDVLTANRNLLTEEEGDDETSSISNARVDIQNGLAAVVSYDRTTKEDSAVRETREWAHTPKGWECVGVSREDAS